MRRVVGTWSSENAPKMGVFVESPDTNVFWDSKKRPSRVLAMGVVLGSLNNDSGYRPKGYGLLTVIEVPSLSPSGSVLEPSS